jgi:K+-sensing histidine kinase KdpD
MIRHHERGAGRSTHGVDSAFRSIRGNPGDLALHSADGAGLGLSICKEIAAAHKWELAARSTSEGAEFILSFGVGTAMDPTESVLIKASAAAG